MNFQFCFNGTPIEPHEAVALLEASSDKDRTKPIIDISDLIDSKSLDANKLFELSVSNKNQELASLAWKISVQQKQTKQNTVKAQVFETLLPASKEENTSLEDIIDYLNNTTNYAALGVALLLNATKQKEWVTLRETAIGVVNKILISKLHMKNSKFLRGFEWDSNETMYMPVDLSSGQKRRNTFHVSPLYIALREGLVYCKKHNLIEQKKMLSVGALYTKTNSPSADGTRRLYYKIKSSERGNNLVKLWADLDRYIEKTFEVQR